MPEILALLHTLLCMCPDKGSHQHFVFCCVFLNTVYFIYVTKALLRIVPVALLVTKKLKINTNVKKYTVKKKLIPRRC